MFFLDIYYIECVFSLFVDIVKFLMVSFFENEDLFVIIVLDVGWFVDEVKFELDDWV